MSVGSGEGQGTPRILVLEDEPELVALYVETLSLEGYLVDGANTIARARELLRQHTYALFLCDMLIGSEHSLDLLRELVPTGGQTQVIMLSAVGQYQEMAHEVGVEFFLTKPVDLDLLVMLVKRLTGNMPAG